MEHISKQLKEDAAKFINQPMGVSTGFAELDETLWGFQPQKLMVIGGRPSMGKSGIMADMILSASKETPVGVFSCEMTSKQFGPRLACNLAYLNYHSVRKGKMTDNEKDKFSVALDEVESLPIFVDYDAGIVGLDEYWLNNTKVKEQDTIDYKIKKWVAEKDCKIFFVDYLQLIKHINPTKKDRRLEVGDIAEILRDYAKNYGVTIVLLSQLRRFEQSRSREDGKKTPPIPTMDDLKESGEIEQHSDVVILLHRPQYYYKEDEIDLINNIIEDDATLIVEKNRDGPTGGVKVDWHAYAMSYKDKEATDVPF